MSDMTVAGKGLSPVLVLTSRVELVVIVIKFDDVTRTRLLLFHCLDRSTETSFEA